MAFGFDLALERWAIPPETGGSKPGKHQPLNASTRRLECVDLIELPIDDDYLIGFLSR